MILAWTNSVRIMLGLKVNILVVHTQGCMHIYVHTLMHEQFPGYPSHICA